MTVSIDEAMKALSRYVPKGFAPKVGMILGSGFSALADHIDNPVSIPFSAVPGLEGSRVTGHASLIVLGELNSVPVVCLRGRLHVYEGVSYDSIKTLIHIIRHLGCTIVIVTGAVGSLNQNVVPGELVMLTDHINFQGSNPLVGPNDESVGPRFVNMVNAYDPGLRDIMRDAARQLGIPLHEGIYISTVGPSFETPAEIRAFKSWGADVVGMSVVPDVIIARHVDLSVLGMTVVTNLAAGLTQDAITHEGTLRFGEQGAWKFIKLVPLFLKEWSHAMA